MADRTHEMRRRYTSLGLGELCAAGVFAAVAVAQPIPLAPPATLALWCALGPLLAVLLQAGVYWLLARRWVGRAAMPARAARGYRWARVLDPVLLAVGLVGIVLVRPTGGFAVLVGAVWLFGAAEYVNYFVVRLAYPWHRWPRDVVRWRTPRLVKDLQARG